MIEHNLQQRVYRGLAWVAGASSMVAVLDIIGLILILKFWIDLEDFGIATTVLAFHGAFELLAEIGLTSAVIQKKEQTDCQLSTIFWLNIVMGLAVFMMIYLLAPLFAQLHGNQALSSLFRLYGVHIILRSLYSCQQALMKRHLRFKELSVIRLWSNSADFIVRITTAACGFGPSCFIWGLLARTAIEGGGVILQSHWSPRFVFQFETTREHIVFGVKTSASEAVYRTYSNVDYWVVSIFFGPAALGLYRAAYELVLEPVRFISLIVVNVAFPTLSRLRDRTDQLANQYLMFIRQNFMVISLFVSCILVSADELLPVLLRTEYGEAAWAARILAIVGLLRALSHLGPPLLDGVGKPGLTLRYQCLSGTLLIGFFFLFTQLFGGSHGYGAVALAWLMGYPINCTVLTVLVCRTLGIHPSMFLRNLVPGLTCLAASCAIGWFGRAMAASFSPPLLLAAGILLTTLSYLAACTLITGLTPRSLIATLRETGNTDAV